MNRLYKLSTPLISNTLRSQFLNNGRTTLISRSTFINRNNLYSYRNYSTESKKNENEVKDTDNKPTSKDEPSNVNENKINNEKQKESNEHHSQKRQITWASLLVAILAGGAGWLYYDHLMVQKREKIKQIETYGSSSIGGSFSLVDEDGKPISDLDFRGKYMLLYFGFTYCPDACPAELDKMTIVLNNLEKYNLLDSIVPVFITIDPWRDTVEQIKTYIQEFHPKFKGLTGTPEQITKLAKSYRVFISKAGKGDSYLVDHTIIEYLIGPDGKFIEFYGSNLTAEQVTMKVVERMANKGLGGANTGEVTKEKSAFDKILSVFSSK